jgi:hypothetical protein
MVTDRRKSHRCEAPALLAIRIASKLAWRNRWFEISRDGRSRSGEDALIRISWRRIALVDQRFRHVEDRVPLPKTVKLSHDDANLTVIKIHVL